MVGLNALLGGHPEGVTYILLWRLKPAAETNALTASKTAVIRLNQTRQAFRLPADVLRFDLNFHTGRQIQLTQRIYSPGRRRVNIQ